MGIPLVSRKESLKINTPPIAGGTWSGMVARDWRKHWPLYLMMLPVMGFYLVWNYGPLYGIIVAFQEFSPRMGILGSPFIGFENFIDFFDSPFAFRVIRNTVLINFYNLLFGFPVPIIFALMLNEIRNRAYKRTVQTITYMPFFISIVVVSGIIVDFTTTTGVFGEVFTMLGLEARNLLAHPRYFRSVYIISEIWQGFGWNSIIFLAALAGINTELYESARMDGAGKLKQIYYITLPGIMPTIAILLILRVGAIMSLGFEKIILLYSGLTFETADVISSFVFRRGIIEFDFGFSAAVGLFNSVVNFALVVFANRASAKLTETSLW